MSQFELVKYNVMKITKYIFWVKSEGRVEPSGYCTVTRFLQPKQNFFINQARSRKPKTVNSEAMLQAIEANFVLCTRRVSAEISI